MPNTLSMAADLIEAIFEEQGRDIKTAKDEEPSLPIHGLKNAVQDYLIRTQGADIDLAHEVVSDKNFCGEVRIWWRLGVEAIRMAEALANDNDYTGTIEARALDSYQRLLKKPKNKERAEQMKGEAKEKEA